MNEGEKPLIAEKPEVKKKSGAKYRMRRICFVLIILLFVWWFNNFTVKINKVEIKSDKVSSSLRIAVISDLHASAIGIGNKTIIKKIDKQKPDIVTVLGDMYTTGSTTEIIEIAVELIEDIVDKGYPVYVVTGEHDSDMEYIRAVTEAGAHIMNYKEEIIELDGNKVQIMGIDNVYFSDTFDLRNAFTVREDCFSLLLAHIPEYEKLSSFGADLILSADTHGGMVQLPFDLGPAYASEYSAWFPQLTLNREIYDKGLFPYEDGNMFITSGLGASPAPIRFNNRPEVAVIDIVPD